MDESAKKGLGWTLLALLFGCTAAFSPNPVVKFLAASGAVATTTQAVRCFQTTARESYAQLVESKPSIPLA